MVSVLEFFARLELRALMVGRFALCDCLIAIKLNVCINEYIVGTFIRG